MDLLALIGFIICIYALVYMIIPWFLDCDMCLAYHESFGKSISSLKDQVVWIVGASSGIGEHLTYVLSQAGCKVVISARRATELETIRRRCIQEYQIPESNIEVLVMDVCQTDNHQTAFNHVIEKFGKLDVLVNNAGRSQRAEWENIELGVDKEMFQLNVFSILSLSRIAVKYFIKVGKGHIVNTSSLAGIVGLPFSATYTGSKHALHGYFNSLKMEKLSENIAVTMVCPGPVQTNFLAECFTDKVNEKYGRDTEISKSKISPERCARLMAVAMANKLSEIWISHPLSLQLTYVSKYYPNVAFLIFKLLGPRFLQRLRDQQPLSLPNTTQGPSH